MSLSGFIKFLDSFTGCEQGRIQEILLGGALHIKITVSLFWGEEEGQKGKGVGGFGVP